VGLDQLAAIEIDYTKLIIGYKQQISYLWKQGLSLSERITYEKILDMALNYQQSVYFLSRKKVTTLI